MNILGLNFNYEKNYLKDREKYIWINDSKVMPCDSVKQLTSAKGAFYNYAKENHVTLSFFDPRNSKKLRELVPNSDIEACIAVNIRKINKKFTTLDQKTIVIDYFKNTEKPFLSRVLDGIRDYVEGTSMLPIEKEKAKTIEKLIKAGKIKA